MRHPKSVVFLIASVLLALVLSASVKSIARGASTSPVPGISLIRLGGGSGTSDNWSTLSNTDKYSVILVSQANASYAAKLSARSLLYACGVNIPATSWSSGCGVSWTTATANSWILKDANGNYVPYSTSSGNYQYLADIGNPAYQQAWIAAMSSVLASYPGVDGVFIDNIVGNLIQPSLTYPDSASYRTAMKSFIHAVGPTLRAKGYYVDVNAIMTDTTTTNWQTLFGNQCDGSQVIWWYNQIAPDVDGMTNEAWEESWQDGYPVRLSGTSSCSQNWDGWQRLVAAVQGMGKDFIPVTYGPTDARGVAKSTYLKASFLLAYNYGPSAFIYTDSPSSTSDPWMSGAPWTLDLGQPSGAKYQVGAGWRRDFAGGTVVVNPSPSTSQTFTLGGTYLLPDGSSPTSVTLLPGTAQILQLAPTTTATSTSTTTLTTTTTATTATSSTTTPTTSTSTTTPTTTTTIATTTTTATPPPPSPPSNLKPPAITGPQLIGKTLTASQGTWAGSPTSYAYQWSRCDSAGANCSPIGGATSSTYDVVAADQGGTLIATVIASNAAGSASANSAPTSVIKDTGSVKKP